MSRHALRRDPPPSARFGLLVAVVLTFGAGVVSCQALGDAPRRTPLTAPVAASTVDTTRTVSTTPAEPYPGAWCGNRCRNGRVIGGDVPRETPVPVSTAAQLTGHRAATRTAPAARPAATSAGAPTLHRGADGRCRDQRGRFTRC